MGRDVKKGSLWVPSFLRDELVLSTPRHDIRSPVKLHHAYLAVEWGRVTNAPQCAELDTTHHGSGSVETPAFHKHTAHTTVAATTKRHHRAATAATSG